MGEDALKYIFWLSMALIVVAYFAGTTSVMKTAGQQLVSIMRSAVGENAQGTAFLSYPSGA